jgi:hypothetical protein
MGPMRTAVVSDLHLGGLADADVARKEEPLAALVEAVSGADRLILLGDIVELRERPLAGALEVSRPVLEALGRAMAGRPVVLVPGNHDHGMVRPWLDDFAEPGLEERVEPAIASPAAAAVAELLGPARVEVAYPGAWLRDDVYATHGHYLDLHLTIPRLESIAASAMGRLTKVGQEARSAAAYETVLAPLYAFYAGLAQGASATALARGSHFSRTVWQRASDGRGVDDPAPEEPAARERVSAAATRFLLGRVTIPGAVAALNVAGLGPFRATLTGEELRRSGLDAMAHVAEVLAPGTPHVIFGHTHRPGPLPRDDVTEWTMQSGTRLWNSGSWLHEGAFVRAAQKSPYWPGTVLTVEGEGPPQVRNALTG